jgi:hypothetical protein
MARRRNPESEAPADPAALVAEAMQAPESVGEAVDEDGAGAPSRPPPEAADDPDPTPTPPPWPSPAPEPPPAAARQGGSGLFGSILGGALAAVGGFGLSHFDAFGLVPKGNPAELAAISARLDALEAAPADDPVKFGGIEDSLSGLEARLAALEAAPAPPAPDLSALDAMDQRLAAIEAMPAGDDASTAALAARLADLERRLAAAPQAGVNTAEVDAALARLDAAEAEATARAAAAAEATAAAGRALALDRLRAAAATGAPFEAELAALGDAELTAALGPHAAGVATPAALQADFPDLVRQALEVTRSAQGDQGWTDRVMDFLAAQTGARPLTPQEGDTPDAILSRADFAVTEGRVADALAEIGALPPEVQAVFSDWASRATARLAVDTALEAR